MTTEIAGMWFVLGILSLILILSIVIIGQFFKHSQIKIKTQAEIARDEAYRKLAEDAITVQKQMAEDLSELRQKIVSMEKLLREVD